MKVIQQVSAIFRRQDDTVPSKSCTRRPSLPANLALDDKPVTGRRARRLSQTLQKKRQVVIRQFLRQGSFLRRRLDLENQQRASERSAETASISSIDDEAEAAFDALDISMQSTPERATPFLDETSNTRRRKTIRWDSSVDKDQHTRALRRNSNLTHPKKGRMAHRVHDCNKRKEEWLDFKREYLLAKEIDVLPATDHWFKRKHLDISAGFMALGQSMAQGIQDCKYQKADWSDFQRKFLKQDVEVAPPTDRWLEREHLDVSAEFVALDIDLFGSRASF